MPFSYKFILGEGFPRGQALLFDSWCDDAWGVVHNAPVKIAVVKAKDGKGFIVTNGPCMPMTKGNLKLGDEIDSETVIGIAAADGESIPYDKPYCVFCNN